MLFIENPLYTVIADYTDMINRLNNTNIDFVTSYKTLVRGLQLA